MFASRDKLGVGNTAAEIVAKVREVTNLPVPLIDLVDDRGSTVTVNANHIREVRDTAGHVSYRTTTF